LRSFFTGLGVLTDGWLFLRLLFWMTLNWSIAMVAYYLITLAISRRPSGVDAVHPGCGGFWRRDPGLPGGVGTFEGAVSGALILLTVTSPPRWQ